jgi:hypothetical protein
MKAIISNHLRKFYYSNRRIKENRTQEFQARKVKDRICAAERRFVQGGDKQRQPILLIGNQGAGVGSFIEGFF